MYFELYVDSLFFMNLTLNGCILYLTDMKLGGTATLRRMITGAVSGSMCPILVLLSGIPIKPAILLGTALEFPVLILVTYRVKNFKGFLKILGNLAEYELILGGILLLLIRLFPKLGSGLKSVAAISLLLIASSIFLSFCKRKNGAEDLCEVILYYGEKERKMTALFDSGNGLCDPISRKPVSVISGSIFSELCEGREPEYYRVIPYNSVGKEHGIMKGFFFPRMEVFRGGIRTTFENVCIGVWEDENKKIPEESGKDFAAGRKALRAEIILNPRLFENKNERARQHFVCRKEK